MNILLIYCNPNSESYSNAIKEILTEVCSDNGHDVRVRDLYALNFNPVLTITEMEAVKRGDIPDEIKEEHDHIRIAELIILIYPLWWNGPPALLKGYVDRVFSYGFAYAYNEQGAVKLLTAKNIIIFTPNGTPKDIYEKNGRYSSINQAMHDGIFRFCGMNVLAHYYFCSGRKSTLPERIAGLGEVRGIAEEL